MPTEIESVTSDQVDEVIDEKMDEFNEQSFPASDAPNWSALRHFKNVNKRKFNFNEASKMDTRRVSEMNHFSLDIAMIRSRARLEIENGAVTPGYACDIKTSVQLLNEALATEIVCVLRYKLHYVMASGLSSESVAKEFLEHAEQEQEHVDKIAARISQLNGEPDFNPKGLSSRARTDYVKCDNVIDMIKENLIAERIVIDIYRELIHFFGYSDPTTRRLLEHILREEEEHADDLSKLLPTLNRRTQF
jgi:bacterioferritin